MPRNRRVDLALFVGQPAADDRVIPLVHFAFLELRGQAKMRRVVLGGDEAAGRVHVQPVHDARAHHAADAAQAPGAVVEQGVDQRAALVPVPGMSRHVGRLVDDDEVVILE